MKKRIIRFLIALMPFLPFTTILAQDANNDGYDDNDVAVLEQIITDNPNNTLIWSGTDYGTWAGVIWNSSIPKRVDTLYISNKKLTTLNVEGLSQLAVLYCYSNELTSLQIKGLSLLNDLVIVNNQLSSLDVTGLNNLEIFNADNNKFSFSALNSFKSINTLQTFTYSNQGKLFEEKTIPANSPIDFSSEAIINTTQTVFYWYKDGTLIQNTDQSGQYIPTEEGTYYCTMTNDEFPDITLTTNNLTVQKYQVQFDVKYKDASSYPFDKIIIEGKDIFPDENGLFKTTLLSGKYTLSLYGIELDDLLSWIPFEVGDKDTVITIKLCKVTFDTRYPDGSIADYDMAGAKDITEDRFYLRDFYGFESEVKSTALMDGTYKLLFAKGNNVYYNLIAFPGIYSCTINPTDTVKVISIILPFLTPHTVTFLASKGNVSQYSIYDSTETSLGGASAAPGTFSADVKYSLLSGTYSISCWNQNYYEFVNHQYFTVSDNDIIVELVLHDYSFPVPEETETVVIYDLTGTVVDTIASANTAQSAKTLIKSIGSKIFTAHLTIGNYHYKAFDANRQLIEENDFHVGEIGDTTVIKITEVEAAGTISATNNHPNISLYPNPADNYVTIQGIKEKTIASIYNLSGTLVLERTINETDSLINISSLSKGMYIIKLNDIDGTVQQKLIKE